MVANRDEVYDKIADSLEDAQRLALVNASWEGLLSVAAAWTEVFDRVIAIDMMEETGAKPRMGFRFDREEDEDE